jgi:hypothetical protein
MKNLLLIVILGIALVTAGCTSENQNPVAPPATQHVSATISQTPVATQTPQIVSPTISRNPAATSVPQIVSATVTATGMPLATATDIPLQGSLKTYTNNEFGFSIQYSGCWTASGEYVSTVGEGKKYVVIFDDPTFTSKQEISITPGSSGLSLDDWTGVFLTQIKTNPAVSVVSQDTTTLGGVPAKKIILTNGSGKDAIESTVIMAVKGNNAYFLEFTSRKDYYPVYSQDADSIIKTFTFT